MSFKHFCDDDRRIEIMIKKKFFVHAPIAAHSKFRLKDFMIKKKL